MRLTKRALLIVIGVVLWASPAQAENLDKLVKRADMIYRGQSSAAVMTMSVKTQSFDRSYKIVAWDDSRKGDRTLIKILGPASWRGHGTLKVGEQLKLFDPKTDRIQVVGHSMLGSSWMGSHFTNDDLVKETRLARDYSLSLVKKWEAPAPVGGNGTFYRIAMTPKPTAPVAWGKIVYELWESPKAIAPSSATYFRKASDTTPARTIAFSDVEELGGRWLPSTMTITVTSKPGEHTRLVYTKLRLDVDIPEDKFTEQTLRH